jgi:hypothetical protein
LISKLFTFVLSLELFGHDFGQQLVLVIEVFVGSGLGALEDLEGDVVVLFFVCTFVMHDLFDGLELAGRVFSVEGLSKLVTVDFVDHRQEVDLFRTHEFLFLLHLLPKCYNWKIKHITKSLAVYPHHLHQIEYPRL